MWEGALGFPMAARGLGQIPEAYLDGQRPVSNLLFGANLGAFVAGAAGIIALGRAKSGAVVGCWCRSPPSRPPPIPEWPWPLGNASGAGQSLLILLVNLAGLLAGGVVTLLGTRVWARRIEAGRAILRPERGL